MYKSRETDFNIAVTCLDQRKSFSGDSGVAGTGDEQCRLGSSKKQQPANPTATKVVTNLWRISWKNTDICLKKTPGAESRNSKDSNQFPEKYLRLWCLAKLQLQQSMSSKCAWIQPTRPLLRFLIFACWRDQETKKNNLEPFQCYQAAYLLLTVQMQRKFRSCSDNILDQPFTVRVPVPT